MSNLRLTVETLSPLLMYGADQDEPELRGSSFRGILRYWLRAVLGARYTDTADLYRAESEILGSTEKGSRIAIRVQQSKAMQEKGAKGGQWVLPERTSKNWKPRYNAFPAGSEFRINLSTHPLDGALVLAEDSPLVKAIFLMTCLGGLGRRARRGSGNLRVKKVGGYEPAEGGLPLVILPDDRDELRDYLYVMSQFINGSQLISHRPNFATFAPNTCVILLGKESYGSVEEVFSNNGDLWRTSGPYHQSGGVFGGVNPRRASAIHMRVALTRAGYVPQQTIFYSGNGAWNEMKRYISDCISSGFEQIYGDESGWQ